MIIKSIELSDFRNFETLKAEFSNGVNIFSGQNANGKTNILESIYLGSTTKSQKGSRDKDIIRFGRDEAHIRLYAEKADIVHKIDMHLRSGKAKQLYVDGMQIKKSTDYLGMIHVVSFSPEDLLMVKEGPALRRRFLDLELCQLDAIYMHNYASYNKVLEQRNNLLKELKASFGYQNPRTKDTLSVWDEQLVMYGGPIIEARRSFIDEICSYAKEIHSKISNGLEELKIEYAPDVTEENFINVLKENSDKDIVLKSTSSGPHRDDFIFLINGNDARKYASQGQQRSCVLSLKLAEIKYVTEKTGELPILLLDDVLSELDRSRQTNLLDSISDMQTFITCTGLEEFVSGRLNTDNVFRVENNTCHKDNRTGGSDAIL